MPVTVALNLRHNIFEFVVVGVWACLVMLYSHDVCAWFRLSHEFLSGQTAELNKKLKDLQNKVKKSPDDLKAQLKTFMAVSFAISDMLQCPV